MCWKSWKACVWERLGEILGNQAGAAAQASSIEQKTDAILARLPEPRLEFLIGPVTQQEKEG